MKKEIGTITVYVEDEGKGVLITTEETINKLMDREEFYQLLFASIMKGTVISSTEVNKDPTTN